jgi:endonuclease IV
MFHISDGIINSGIDKHLSIGLGNFDFEYFLSKIKKKSYVTIETPKELDKRLNDIKLLKFYENNT